MLRFSFLTGPRHAGPPLGHKNAVGHRHIRGRMTVENELDLDLSILHRRGRFLLPRNKNSVNACTTKAEIVLPETLACSRTRSANAAGNRTVNTVVASGTATRPPAAARSAYRRACRTEQPHRTARMRAASATGTPDSNSSAAALTRAANSPASARTRPPAMT
jgi:hypothetical protein